MPVGVDVGLEQCSRAYHVEARTAEEVYRVDAEFVTIVRQSPRGRNKGQKEWGDGGGVEDKGMAWPIVKRGGPTPTLRSRGAGRVV